MEPRQTNSLHLLGGTPPIQTWDGNEQAAIDLCGAHISGFHSLWNQWKEANNHIGREAFCCFYDEERMIANLRDNVKGNAFYENLFLYCIRERSNSCAHLQMQYMKTQNNKNVYIIIYKYEDDDCLWIESKSNGLHKTLPLSFYLNVNRPTISSKIDVIKEAIVNGDEISDKYLARHTNEKYTSINISRLVTNETLESLDYAGLRFLGSNP